MSKKKSFCSCVAFLLSIVLCSRAAHAQEDMGEADYSTEDSSYTPKPKAQGQNFFEKSKGDQNFFGGRNLSSNSIFSEGGVSMGANIPTSHVQAPQDSFDTSQQVHQNQVPVPHDEQNQEVELSQQQTESIVSNAQGADPGIQDVVEHSRKIRQAIFGDEAAKTLPKAVRDKLPSSQPTKKIEEMRF